MVHALAPLALQTNLIPRQPGIAVFAVVFVMLAIGLSVLQDDNRRKLRAGLLLWCTAVIAVLISRGEMFSSGLREWSQLVGYVSLSLSTVRTGWVLLFDAALKNGSRLGISRIGRDLGQASLSLIAAIAAARAAGADAQSLATTGGLVTAGLTFSLQQTLGDLVAGLLLQGQAPFQMGDWIAWGDDPHTMGRVTEINWRATTIITLDEVAVTVPNSVLARAPIFNYNQPKMTSRCSVRFSVSYDAPPAEVKRLAIEALEGVQYVDASLGMQCWMEDFESSGIRYWLWFFIQPANQRDNVQSIVRTRLWHRFRRAGIEFVFPRTEIALVPNSEEVRQRRQKAERAQRLWALKHIDLLSALTAQQLDRLVDQSETRLFSAGELLVRKGDPGHEMFIVANGTLAVLGENDRTEIARVNAGEFFGEMALLTGEPRSASIRAITDCEIYVVHKTEFETMFRENPTLLESISNTVTARQADNLRYPGIDQSDEARTLRSNTLLAKMRRFFSL